MKSLIFSAVFGLSQIALACPGSHLMTFKMNGQEAFILNMQTGKLNRAESNKNVALLNLEVNGSQICAEDIRVRSRCSKMFPTLNILGRAGEVSLFNQQINLVLTLTDGINNRKLKVDRFPGLARSARGCGPIVQ